VSQSNLDSYIGLQPRLLFIELCELERRRNEVIVALENALKNQGESICK
jgi:hypothetical protein